MKRTLLTLLAASLLLAGHAQRSTSSSSKSEGPRGFQKDRLFTGGTFSLGFSNGYFLAGISPEFGYNLAPWLDGGIVANYNYTSQQDILYVGDKAHQSVYGGGVFTRIFPVSFLFAQGQLEHNFIRLKYFNPAGSTERQQAEATSLLVGPGYSAGREGGGAYGYLAVLFDVLKNPNSPYIDNQGRITPQIRAGFNIPLFRGKRNPNFDRGGPLKR